MCGRFGRLSRFERIAQLMPTGLRNEAGEFPPTYNIAPGTQQPIIASSSDGTAVLRPVLWGSRSVLGEGKQQGCPSRKRQGPRRQPNGPMFKKLIRQRRCLVPADWFYEWKVTPTGKVPHVIQMASREPFLLGGMWDTWHYGQPDAPTTFCLLTTLLNELAGSIHDRMSLIVAPEDAPRWLDRAEHDIDDLLRPYPAMTVYPVSTRVNSSKNEGPELIEPWPAGA